MESRVTHVAVEPASPLSDAAIGSLRESFRGELLRTVDPGYEAARHVWNGSVDRHPTLIARCTGTADVVAAVRFARAEGLPVAVRGGGHSVAGHGTVDGGIVLDLSPMGAVRVDPVARRAWVQGGARLGQLDHETALHGLATTAGTVSHTGVGGLTLGGGYGFLARRHGLACDNVVSAEVVTAAGEVVTASETENADLLWGLRGGGGNFGIVTSFEFQLHPAPPSAATGDLFFDLADGLAVVRAVSDLADEMPAEMLLDAAVTEVKAEWEMADLEVGRPLVVASWYFLGDADEGRRAAASLYACAKPLAESSESISYRRLQSLADASQRDGVRRYWKGGFVWELTDEAIEAFLDRRGPSDGPVLWGGEIFTLGGAIARVGEDETAFSGRTARFDFLSLSSWEDPAEDEARLAGARAYAERMTRHLRGEAYVNSLSPDEAADRVRQAYGPAKYERLVALKRKYDLQNMFRLNQNIAP